MRRYILEFQSPPVIKCLIFEVFCWQYLYNWQIGVKFYIFKFAINQNDFVKFIKIL
jgi:hypothetical protein